MRENEKHFGFNRGILANMFISVWAVWITSGISIHYAKDDKVHLNMLYPKTNQLMSVL